MTELIPPLTAEHRERAARALAFLEHAQHLVADAAELLSPIPGMADEWESVRSLYFEIRDRRDDVNACLALLEEDRGRGECGGVGDGQDSADSTHCASIDSRDGDRVHRDVVPGAILRASAG